MTGRPRHGGVAAPGAPRHVGYDIGTGGNPGHEDNSIIFNGMTAC
jgi:hypothetical protein